MALLTANVTVTFPSLIVISAGILPVTVIIMAMIYTCLLIRKVTYRYFLIFAVLQNMIHMDSAHDAMSYYQYFKRENITPFIDLNGKGGRPPVYKNDFTIDKDGVPVCPSGCRMRRDGVEVAKGRMKFKCPKISHKNGCISCTCETPCSDAKYGRTVHLVMKDNPRLFNNPPRSSKEWKLEYNARTSAERSNKREKLDFKLEDGRHRSTKMWYCRLYHILMLQHLDAWNLPSESTLKKMILDVA